MTTITITNWEHRLLRQAYAPLENLILAEAVEANQNHLRRAYAHCTAVTATHSRTFYLASALLPPAERQAMRALYAFCRVSDDLIDRESDRRRQKFQQWRQHIYHPCPTDEDEDPVVLAWADTRARYAIPQQYIEQLLDGVARDLSFARYETFTDLTEYCYGVASTVGLMSMHITGFSGNEAIPYAVKLGVALQLTNILRDVAEDWAHGRCYLPQDELADFGLTEAHIADGRVDRRWRAFMQFQIARTRQLYAEALPGIGLLHRRGRFAVAAAAELYQGILDDIEAHDYDVFTRRAHLNGRDKLIRLPGIWWRSTMNRYATYQQLDK